MKIRQRPVPQLNWSNEDNPVPERSNHSLNINLDLGNSSDFQWQVNQFFL